MICATFQLGIPVYAIQRLHLQRRTFHKGQVSESYWIHEKRLWSTAPVQTRNEFIAFMLIFFNVFYFISQRELKSIIISNFFLAQSFKVIMQVIYFINSETHDCSLIFACEPVTVATPLDSGYWWTCGSLKGEDQGLWPLPVSESIREVGSACLEQEHCCSLLLFSV